ncbi:MAG TPA: PilZ domain-containing protein [Anaeromyxobacteraceae bacterium]|nr:PilZ domain-containing protein [Anaeromyxobacteraceae bacterium]
MASRVLVVGQDADVSIALHLHLERAGFAVYCLAAPGDMEPLLKQVAPHVIVLMLPAAPDATWGGALTAAQGAARVGVRVVLVAPAREVVEPLAAVAGADRAMARAEVLSRPMSVVERPGPQVAVASAPAPAARAQPPPPFRPSLQEAEPPAPAPKARSPLDLMALIDEELVDEPRKRLPTTRVEVNVSLVSEHNFYVGTTRRIDSGGVFIATMMPPPVGTRLQVRLGLADGRKIDLEGEVSFVRAKSATTGRQPSGCGVRLFNLPGWSVDAVEKFFLARQPILYVPT